MKNKKWARKPKRKMVRWLDFILADDATPAVVEARNNGGGLILGKRYPAFDFEGEYFAIRNQADNAVWCHKDNLKLLSRGSVKALEKYKQIKFIDDYFGLIQGKILL